MHYQIATTRFIALSTFTVQKNYRKAAFRRRTESVRRYSHSFTPSFFLWPRTHWQIFLDKFFSPRKTWRTGPLVKFSLVKSHLWESWRARFRTSLTSENLVCVHTGESRRQARRENSSKKTCPCVRGHLSSFRLSRLIFGKAGVLAFQQV